MKEIQEMRIQFLGWEDPLDKGNGATPVFLPNKSLDRGAWQATVHGVANS